MGVTIVVLAAAAAAHVLNLRLFRPVPEGDRSLKFLRASHVWLLVSLAMLVAALNAAAAPPEGKPALAFDNTVVEWVRRYPATLAVFAGFGMDSCCGGAETVANAAAHNNVDLAALAKELGRHAR